MKNIDWKTVRGWFYSVLISAGPIITFYGLASESEVVLWMGLGATILGVPGGSTALANLSNRTTNVVVAYEEPKGEVQMVPTGFVETPHGKVQMIPDSYLEAEPEDDGVAPTALSGSGRHAKV